MSDLARTVLFIDDDEEARFIFEHFLQRLDVPGIAASSGTEALEIIQERGLAIGLVLMDLKMPEMNGLETSANIRLNPLLGDLPIILVTASSDLGLMQQATEAGVTKYILKPITQATIQNLLVEYHLTE